MSEAWPFLDPLQRQALKRLKFGQPTEIQSRVLPAALQGDSLAAIAPTGTGKTLCYLLPIWHSLHNPASHALIMVPTRELGYQISQMAEELNPALRSMSVLTVGGHALEPQLHQLRSPWRVIIATPGRLLDLIHRLPKLLRPVNMVVLDEFDKLMRMGFREQSAEVLRFIPKGAQTLLFSATDPDPGDENALGLKHLPRICIEHEGPKDSLTEAFYLLKTNKKKGPLLLEALQATQGQCLIFVRNREKANHLNGLLRLKNLPVTVLHGKLDQKERAKAYQQFRDGKVPVMVATDLAARGLDISRVDLVINFDLPQNAKDYLHRSGRTARVGRLGTSLSFAGPDEYIQMRNLEEGMPYPPPLHPAFANREAWFAHAKRVHDGKVKREERKERIRKAQGLA